MTTKSTGGSRPCAMNWSRRERVRGWHGQASPCEDGCHSVPVGNRGREIGLAIARGDRRLLLRPELRPDGSLILDSNAERFGDSCFYRLQARGPERVRVWHIRSRGPVP